MRIVALLLGLVMAAIPWVADANQSGPISTGTLPQKDLPKKEEIKGQSDYSYLHPYYSNYDVGYDSNTQDDWFYDYYDLDFDYSYFDADLYDWEEDGLFDSQQGAPQPGVEDPSAPQGSSERLRQQSNDGESYDE